MNIKFDLILPAAGGSMRYGENKLLLTMGGVGVIAKSVAAFCDVPGLNAVIVPVNADRADEIKVELSDVKVRVIYAKGGNTRCESVKNALKLVESEFVVIHDAARPFVSQALINNVLEKVITCGSAVPALAVSDSIRYVENGKIEDKTLSRENFYNVQTPQAYVTEKLKYAFSQADNYNFTDESALYAKYVTPPAIICGEPENKKITVPSDFFGINAKIGVGYDIHRLIYGRKLMLCGIEIASDFGALAHSDGDCALHAVTDALLSAVGETDIGTHFPDTNPKYDGADSALILRDALQLPSLKNIQINNLSLIIVLDKPKLSDYIPVMKIKLGNILGLRPEKISIAAKTSEKTAENTVSAYAAVTLI